LSIHRFHVPPAEVRGNEFALPAAEAHHAIKVLRCRVGDPVQVLDGCGRTMSCEIIDVSRREVRVRTREVRSVGEPSVRVILFQAITKGKSFDLILEKATEIGVSEIVPVICERAVAVPDGKQALAKAEKWRHTAIAALKQSGRAWLPVTHPVTPFFSAVSRSEKCDWKMVAALDPTARPLKDWLRGVGGLLSAGSTIAVWIGPEGDFTESEYHVMRSRGFSFATLGDAVLRAETAAICALACIRYEVGDRA
jgi:16S rRNA (uracil1498-N3)-methyltransferase